MAHDLSDSELVRRFQRGERSAYEALVRRHQHRTLRLAHVWLDDAHGAEDAVQEVFLRAYTGLGRFRFAAAPATWLFRMTRNVCNELNRKNRQRNPPALDDIATQTPALAQEHHETIVRVRRLVAALPPGQRDVVLLRVFEELSVADTARVLRIRPGTVKATLHQALGRLRQQFGEGDAL